MGKYTRATSVGYNTGKVIIGCCFIPKSKPMTQSEYFIQGIIRGRGLPAEVLARDIWLKLKSLIIK